MEDNPLHARLVTSMLADAWPDMGRLLQARRLDQALTLVRNEDPDCVLLDLVLPDADGLEALDAVLGVSPEVPVVVLSSHDDDRVALEALRRGAQDYLVKGSVDGPGLLRAIRYAMRRGTRTGRPDPTGDRAEGSATPATPEERGSAAVGFALLDRTGTIRFAEEGVAEMFGRPVSLLVGLSPADVTHPDDRDRWREAFGRVGGAPGRPTLVEVRIRHAAGHDQRVDVELHALRGRSRQVEAVVARYRPHPEEGTASSGGSFVVMPGWNS